MYIYTSLHGQTCALWMYSMAYIMCSTPCSLRHVLRESQGDGSDAHLRSRGEGTSEGGRAPRPTDFFNEDHGKTMVKPWENHG